MEIARRSRLHVACGAWIDLLFTMSDTTRTPTSSRKRESFFSRTRFAGAGRFADRPPGGARRDRTDDLLLAKQALSQLSYGPFRDQASVFSNQSSETRVAPSDYCHLITD